MGNRVYQGRFKGSTLTHMPNDKVRENMDKHMGPLSKSYVVYECADCSRKTHVHKLEVKVFRCLCGSLHQK
jgi:hypothetical protein